MLPVEELKAETPRPSHEADQRDRRDEAVGTDIGPPPQVGGYGSDRKQDEDNAKPASNEETAELPSY